MADLMPQANKAKHRLKVYQEMQAFVGDSAPLAPMPEPPPEDMLPEPPVVYRKRGQPKTFINAIRADELVFEDGGKEIRLHIDMAELERETKVYQWNRKVYLRLGRSQEGKYYLHLDYTTPL